jgi:hypothetical protein
MASNDSERLIPTGFCWCGCGKEVGLGKFFASGHDKTAEAAYMAVHYGGSVARLLAEEGYGPGGKATVRQAALRDGGWEECEVCGYAGAPASVTNHIRKYHNKEN